MKRSGKSSAASNRKNAPEHTEEVVELASPPCFLHELDPDYMGLTPRQNDDAKAAVGKARPEKK